MIEQLTGEPSLRGTHEIHQGIAWRGAGGPVDGEATGTVADIPGPSETREQWERRTGSDGGPRGARARAAAPPFRRQRVEVLKPMARHQHR